MFPPVLPVTRALLIANVVVFLLQSFLSEAITLPFMQWPIDFTGSANDVARYAFMPWQPLTSGFMHAGPLHLLFNMLMLWMFGSSLEAVWGEKRFTTYYFVCLIGSSLCQLLVSSWILSGGGQAYPAMGASGAVFGLLLGYGMLFPERRMVVFPIPMEIRARTLVLVYGALTLLFAVTGWQSGATSFGYLGGMIFGWLMIRYWRGQPPFGKRRPPGPRMRIVK
ncbi:rhomboid family intramembrane serine protease [Pseudomonas sp. R2.Fl]|nr:rhomboid family intramembrane serine protease [Pseudomonas sp. R2.Fl]